MTGVYYERNSAMEEMNEGCTHDCSTCSADCSSRQAIQKEAQNAKSNIKRVIGIVSGKGGVGKSLVTDIMAVLMRRRDYNVAVLDADITGPSAPKAFGANGEVMSDGEALIPYKTTTGIKMMSVNLLLEDETSPVVWRGPIIAGTVKQFWTDVAWGDVDFMFVDMPPGTGDVPLTVFQSLPLDGIIIVATPQELVSMIVKKAINMAEMMNVPVIGYVMNMAYALCPDCGKKLYVFGEPNKEQITAEYNIPCLGELPLDPRFSALCDKGIIELLDSDALDKAADAVEAFTSK